ncbi:GNAT family N-acetyltransferase [Rosistilla oblonga]|uniref:Acetyltransferase (GNAT) family protein n=1 Tax=Rosistilla oblonga TaxID=2527990 RepID=A0A518IMJ6_9BACT|nr:GNAT family N-acetyltransferase [Rosistilla oblonga]QDV54307.1 Acetyltransferase (GNAT) family protein [Rosistilla oblonga]
MNRPILREMTPDDAARVIALNEAAVDVTSPIDADRFAELYELSSVRLVAETNCEVVGFVLAMTDACGYDNGNYRWFAKRLKNFLYIDRIVVSATCRGLGLGRLIYSRIYELARQTGSVQVCAEMDLNPPNNASLDFHSKAGFIQLGTRSLESGKQVSMQTRFLPCEPEKS